MYLKQSFGIDDGRLFTIGYSGWSIADFVRALARHRIDVLCDVRSVPYSRFRPEYSRQPLKTSLNAAGIKYVFFGEELGARPKSRNVYINGQAAYDLIASQKFFQAGLDRVRNGVQNHNLALLCAEHDPLECHRAILVCHHLPEIHERTFHIHRGDHIESQIELETRLVALHKLTPPPLLADDRAWKGALREAYAKQSASIAFTEREVDGSSR